jgi:hypothetical protein
MVWYLNEKANLSRPLPTSLCRTEPLVLVHQTVVKTKGSTKQTRITVFTESTLRVDAIKGYLPALASQTAMASRTNPQVLILVIKHRFIKVTCTSRAFQLFLKRLCLDFLGLLAAQYT